jgi:HD-GYP domain-containing protein (c-di-GMP phosphodiesterase class II)/HAMP domain-containing protein
MGTDSASPTKRYPLHVTISITFAALLLAFGCVLILFNYVESRRIALLGAEDQLDRVGTHMRTSVGELYEPVQNLVDVSSRVLPEDDLSIDERLESVGFLTEALRLKHRISSVFVGYENGDFFLVRRSNGSGGSHGASDGPRGTRFVVQSIEMGTDGAGVEEIIYLNDSLGRLERRALDWTGFDPREREWYTSAQSSDAQIVSSHYVFFTSREVGVTIARRLAGGGGVVGADLAMSDLSAGLAEQQVTSSSRLAMLEPDGGVIALSDPWRQPSPSAQAEGDRIEMPHLSDLEDPVYAALADRITGGELTSRFDLSVDGRVWLVSLSTLPVRASESILLANIVPRDELLAGVSRVRDQSVVMSLILLAVALVVVVAVSRHLSRSLRKLALAAEDIRALRLETPLTVRSRIREVDDLAETMGVMRSSIQQFLVISQALSAEKDFDRLLDLILDEARRVSEADGGAILLWSEDGSQLDLATHHDPSAGPASPELTGARDFPRSVPLEAEHQAGHSSVDRRTALAGETIRVDDASSDHGYDLEDIRARFERDGTPIRSLMSVPLRTQQGDVIGVLQLVKSARPGGNAAFAEETVPYMEALSSNAAVALDNRRLLKAQRDLLESFIQVLAGAIDAKSPYTHGHCQRVPVLARMLAEAAHDKEDGPFRDFRLSDDEWYELHLASWLHDCGKVTTPEYVVDKSTKLETLYNRIHEIRMRFEVLCRDAQIEHLEAVRTGVTDETALEKRLEQRLAQIRDDFEFVARCNLGEEPMSEEKVERVRRIAAQTWVRHLDDRSGLSHGELLLRKDESTRELPVREPVLVDKPEHVVRRDNGDNPLTDDPHGFRLDVPEHLYDHGEIHNLCVRRGTLTTEERFKINENIIQTLRMLGRLPFPRELRRVPDWAGNHHEKVNGTGYPRRLTGDQLSIPSRIMAIADIFEALTAVDRPYMPPKTLSRSIDIMRAMRDDGHICPELFALFLSSGVHLHYASEHLQPEQIDTVDVDAILEARSPEQKRARA